MITSKWNIKKKVLEIVYTNEITTDQMKNSFEQIGHSQLPLDLRAIIYIRTSEYIFDSEKKKLVKIYIEGILQKFNSIKVALILENNDKIFDTPIAMLYALTIDRYEYKVFSDVFSAILWLQDFKIDNNIKINK